MTAYCDEILSAMNQAGVPRAVICGISYGGLVASVFAARHPERVSGLVLASALPPTWRPDSRIAVYLRWPTLMTPLFLAASVRLYVEIRRASPHAFAALGTAVSHAGRALSHMFSPRRMAQRAATVGEADFASEIRTVVAPTLIIVGNEDMERVVPVSRTLEYTRWLPQARVVTLERTGHLGCVTRPGAFANLVAGFVAQQATDPSSLANMVHDRPGDRRRLG
jgi:pimeloyl-ACP methyl ester carboxylesterase